MPPRTCHITGWAPVHTTACENGLRVTRDYSGGQAGALEKVVQRPAWEGFYLHRAGAVRCGRRLPRAASLSKTASGSGLARELSFCSCFLRARPGHHLLPKPSRSCPAEVTQVRASVLGNGQWVAHAPAPSTSALSCFNIFQFPPHVFRAEPRDSLEGPQGEPSGTVMQGTRFVKAQNLRRSL